MDDGKVMSAIGPRIKEQRQRLRLTQQTIADLILVTKVTQIKYEAGTTVPKASYLALFAKEGADVLCILTGRHTPEVRQIDKDTMVLEAEEAALLDNYSSPTPTGQAAIRQVGVAYTEPAAKRGAERQTMRGGSGKYLVKQVH